MVENELMLNAHTEIDDIFANKEVALANALIQAREKTSLLESKIEFLSIYRMGEDMKTLEKTDVDGRKYNIHYVTISTAEIRSLIGRKGGSIYSQVEAAALELKQKVFIYRDPHKNEFSMKSLYGDVTYNSGKLTVEFNPDTEYLFLKLKDNFTRIKLDIAFKFQTNGGFQLYKLLKTYAYTLGAVDVNVPQEEQEYILRTYSLSELRLQLGYVDLNQADIKKEGSRANPDPDKMVSMEKKPKYKRWVDFYTRVLTPGVEEINKISDIYIVSMEKICSAHGKVDSVRFKIQNNLAYYESKEAKNKKDKHEEVVVPALTEEEMDDLVDEIRMLIDVNLKTRDIKKIAEAAGYDISKIDKACKVLEASSNVENVTGFLIKAIEENYDIPVKRSGQKLTKNYSGRDNDYDDLTARLVRDSLDD